MSRHTPGPWKVEYSRSERKHSFVGDGMWFGKMSWTVTGERNHADARLIAAAPDLLEALMEFVHPYQSGELTERERNEMALAAIAKAEGRS